MIYLINKYINNLIVRLFIYWNGLVMKYYANKSDVMQVALGKKWTKRSINWQINGLKIANWAGWNRELCRRYWPLTVTLCSPVPGWVNRSTWTLVSPTLPSSTLGSSVTMQKKKSQNVLVEFDTFRENSKRGDGLIDRYKERERGKKYKRKRNIQTHT